MYRFSNNLGKMYLYILLLLVLFLLNEVSSEFGNYCTTSPCSCGSACQNGGNEVSNGYNTINNCQDGPEDSFEYVHDIIVTDLKLGDIDGLAVLEEAKRQNADTAVILITAYATIDTCKEAIRRGAYDYLVKPIDINQLRTLVEQAGRKISIARGRKPSKAAEQEFEFEGMRGESPAIVGIFNVSNISLMRGS